jgi:hypothetical protein
MATISILLLNKGLVSGNVLKLHYCKKRRVLVLVLPLPFCSSPRRQSALKLNKITVWHVVYGISSYDKRASLRRLEYFVIFILNFINPTTRLQHYQGCGDNSLHPALITTKGYVGRVVGGMQGGVLNCKLYVHTCVYREDCFDPRHYVLKRSTYANKHNRLEFCVQCALSVLRSYN